MNFLLSLSTKVWQATAGLLLVALVFTGIALAFSNHRADGLATQLDTVKSQNAVLESSITTQNTAIQSLQKEGDARIELAAVNLKLATAQTSSAVAALESIKNNKAQTCTDAMPLIRAALKELKNE